MANNGSSSSQNIQRSSLNNQNETSYLLGGKSSSIGPGSGESTIRPPTSTDSLHASSGLSGSSSSPSLLSSSNNQLGLGSTGILNDSAIEGSTRYPADTLASAQAVM